MKVENIAVCILWKNSEQVGSGLLFLIHQALWNINKNYEPKRRLGNNVKGEKNKYRENEWNICDLWEGSRGLSELSYNCGIKQFTQQKGRYRSWVRKGSHWAYYLRWLAVEWRDNTCKKAGSVYFKTIIAVFPQFWATLYMQYFILFYLNFIYFYWKYKLKGHL